MNRLISWLFCRRCPYQRAVADSIKIARESRRDMILTEAAIRQRAKEQGFDIDQFIKTHKKGE